MKAVIQRVTSASVTIEGKVAGEIGDGFLVLLGVGQDDTEAEVEKVVKKMIGLRIFQDNQGKTNLSLRDVGGQLLIISQFTLLADCRKGRRPSFVKAGNPENAKKLYEKFIELCKEAIEVVEHGEFGADMKVALVNDGPFTIILDSDELN